MQNKIHELVSSDSIIDFVSPSADILKEPFILIFATVIQSYWEGSPFFSGAHAL